MLQTEVSDVVAERQQKVIVAIMSRTEKSACLSNKLVQVHFGFGCHRQGRFAVRRDVDVVRRILSRCQLDFAEIAACEYRRIHERVQGHRREIDCVSILFRSGKSCPVLPSGRKLQTWRKQYVMDVEAFGIKQNLIPAQNIQGICRRRASGKSARGSRKQKIKIRV